MERTATNVIAALAALAIVAATWVPVLTIPAAQPAPIAMPAIA